MATQQRAKRRLADTRGLEKYSNGAFSLRSLEQHRQNGSGPPYIRINSKIVYDLDLFDEWLDRNIVDPVGEVSK